MHSLERYSGAKRRIVRPKFCCVSDREVCAIASSSRSDCGVIRRSNPPIRSDFLSAKLSSVSTNDIRIISAPRQRSQTPINSFVRQQTVRPLEPVLSPYGYKKAASGVPDAAGRNAIPNLLECDIHPGPGHTEVFLRSIHEIPAEITDPADMRCKANFQAAADLAQRLRLATCMTNRLESVESFSRFSNEPVDWPLAAAKDRAASTKNVWRKARAVDRITQR